ncbi:AAEL006709-PA [Aedes aegypti]|uniref:AAEL006709-PA n=1 Tax=Aedes aegypti TaxID=7159 RepID=Q175B4_AEDAE|nr:AAEL006709-PA [Aedes aegypti]
MEGEVSVLLVITVIIGTVLMTSLLACYICVFRQLCCSTDMDLDRSYSQRSSKRTYTLRDSTNMAEITNITSQQTEIEKV